jgi:hypothetical protein
MSEAIIQDFRHELTWFSVETDQIMLYFGAVKVAISSNAEIIEPGGAINRIDSVWEHRGHLQAIWRLLGRSMTGFVMDDDSFRLPFEDGALIRAKNKKAYDFVTVWGPDPRCETGYPTALGTPDPKIMEAMRQMMEGPGPKLFFPFPYTPEFLESFRNSPPRIKWDPPPKPPRPHPILSGAGNGKKITLDNAGEFGKFTVDPDAVTLATIGLSVRFNHAFEVIDAAGQVHESIDAKARTGDLDALWKLVRTDMARLEMDADSFRIDFQDGSIVRTDMARLEMDADSFRSDFQDGSIVRSVNQLDVRRPNLEQVDFWQPDDDPYNSPMPKDPQHYPANLVDSEGCVRNENLAPARV